MMNINELSAAPTMKKLALALTIPLLVLTACNETDQDTSLEFQQSDKRSQYVEFFQPRRAAPHATELQVVRKVTSLPEGALVMDLAVGGDQIVAAVTGTGVQLGRIDLANGSLNFCESWHGPSGPIQFADASRLTRAANAEVFFVFDQYLQESREIDLTTNDCTVLTNTKLEAGVSSVVRADDQWVAVGLFPGELLRIYSTDGAFLAAHGVPPMQNELPELNIYLNQNRMAVRHEPEPTFAVAFRRLPRLHFFDATGELLRMVSAPEALALDYDRVKDEREGIFRLVSNQDTRLAYLDVAANDQYVFGLFSGRRPGDYGAEARSADQVHVFDWEGRFIEELKLDRSLYLLAAHPQDGRLFGASAESDRTSLVEFPAIELE